MEYKDTLNLPKTDFPMKGNLPVREPERVEKWRSMDLYNKIIEKNKTNEPFVLHDGPPYANGHIHFGHILNKVLKDIVVKYRNMSGFVTEYIPGWDCHGLPIELQVEKEFKKAKKEMDLIAIRKRCREYAMEFVNIQGDEFQRMGVLGDWDNPYLTMQNYYESSIVREFGNFVKGGYVYKGKKPVYWCSSCQTALAEAEVEYQDHKSHSIYVKFPIADEAAAKDLSPDGLPVYAVIWTTTPWTIPSNLAIALNSSYEYKLVKVGAELWILADALLEGMMKEVGIEDYSIVKDVSPVDLEKKVFKHPLIDRDSLLILGDHVTMEAGTGCVHTAPGHGRDDYEIGIKYGLDAFAPIDNRGCFTKEVGLEYLEGLHVEASNEIVIDKLKESGALVWNGRVDHSYPHCWRCKKPIVFRSTEQWFISMKDGELRSKALEAVDKVRWIPTWGRERIFSMLENRPDWCISRQRGWGVPIIALRCKSCEKEILSPELIDHVADLFAEKGADVWFSESVESLIPDGFNCPHCESTELEKENDIIDVWFESGVSYAAVIESRLKGKIPVDLYLEGSDQHRGWFHSSLLTSVANRKMAPYKAVLTHGFVVDAKGKKYSKSAGNYVPPEKILKGSGAEILRLWVAAEDYRNDIRVSNEILTRLTEAYRKIRNTSRFILGNISDFEPEKDTVALSDMTELDKWILHRLQLLTKKCLSSYEDYQFHVIYHALNEFCIVDLSAFYLDITKDRLYCEKTDGSLRRSAQTAMYIVLDTIAKLMAPILSFTSDEIWENMPEVDGRADSIHLVDLPKVNDDYFNEELAARWDRFKDIRSEATKILETARKDKVIGNSLQAKLIVEASQENEEFLKSFGDEIADLFIVSSVEFGKAVGDLVSTCEDVEGLKIAVLNADGDKCERCWKIATSVGSNDTHPTLCSRCASVVG